MTPRLPVPVLLAAILTLAACGSLSPQRKAFLHDLVAVESADGQRRWDDAETGALQLLPAADRPSERCALLMVLARAARGRGQPAEALDRYGRVGRECAQDPLTSAQGLFEAARVVAEHDPDPLKSLPMFEQVATTFPDEPAATRSLLWGRDLLLRHRDADAAVAWLRHVYQSIRDTRAGGWALFHAAELVRDRPRAEGALDARLEAVAMFDLLAKRQPEGPLADDALLESARIHLDLGLAKGALERANRILQRRETSWYFGSYDLPTFPEAARLRARAIWRDTRDVDRTIEAWEFYLEHYGRGRAGSRTLYELWGFLREQGRPDQARGYLERLARVEPPNRWARWAKRYLSGETTDLPPWL